MRWPTTAVGLLMMEHRLIERALETVPNELASRVESGDVVVYIDVVVDFLRFYADRTHHGKEEEVLFRRLADKSPAPDIARLMEELLAEHAQSRQWIARLDDANGRLRTGDRAALEEVRQIMGELVAHYARHIEKEDRHFFKPSMAYFSPAERDAMLSRFSDLDRTMVHEKYRSVVEGLEGGGSASTSSP